MRALRRARQSAGHEAGKLELDAGAALGRAAGAHVTAVRVGDRAHDRQAEAGAAGGAVARGVGAVEAIEDALALLGRDARDRRLRREAQAPAGAPSRRAGARARSGRACARSRCRSGCAAPARGGRGRPPASPRDASPSSKRRVGEQAHAVPQLARRTARSSIGSSRRNSRLLALGQQQQVVDESARCARSRPARGAPRGAPPPATGRSCAASTSSWPRITVSGVRSSCEASATNARWPGERLGQPVEHVVEGVGQHAHLAPWPPGSWMRGCRSPASTRAATAAIRRSGRDTRVPIRYDASSAPASASMPARMNARATPPGHARPPTSGSPHADRRRAAAAQSHAALEQAQLADVGQRQRRVAGGHWSAACADSAFSCACSAGALAVVGRPRWRTAPVGW